MPVIYICENDQYHLATGRSLGYKWNTYFLSGKVTGSDLPSWRGQHRNMTFTDLLAAIYNTHDLDSVRVFFNSWKDQYEVETGIV